MVCPRMLLGDDDDDEETPSEDEVTEVGVRVGDPALWQPPVLVPSLKVSEKVMYDAVERMLYEFAKEAADAMSRQWVETAPRPVGVPDFDFGFSTEFGYIGDKVKKANYNFVTKGAQTAPYDYWKHIKTTQKQKDAAAMLRKFEELLKQGVKPKVLEQSAKGAGVFRLLQKWIPVSAKSMGAIMFAASIIIQMRNADPGEAYREARELVFADWIRRGIMDPAWKGTGWYTGAGEDFPGLLG